MILHSPLTDVATAATSIQPLILLNQAPLAKSVSEKQAARNAMPPTPLTTVVQANMDREDHDTIVVDHRVLALNFHERHSLTNLTHPMPRPV